MKCKYSVKYYNKIKKPKTEVSWLKSMLFYSENDERLTFFPEVHSVYTRWSRAPLLKSVFVIFKLNLLPKLKKLKDLKMGQDITK